MLDFDFQKLEQETSLAKTKAIVLGMSWRPDEPAFQVCIHQRICRFVHSIPCSSNNQVQSEN